MRPAFAVAPIVLASTVWVAACSSFPDIEREERWPRPERGAVVAEHPLAVQVGLDVLDRGGNAADAAVATALALAVCYPKAGNLGGGGFALFVPHAEGDDRTTRALDFREVAPRALTAELFMDEGVLVRDRALLERLSVGVPGSPHGLYSLHRAYGRLLWRDVVRPAIALARQGFAVDAWLAYDLVKYQDKLMRSAGARRVFYPRGVPLREGDWLVQADLAATLEAYASQGPRGFYQGAVAGFVEAEMQRGEPGVLDGEDLATYESLWRDPLRGWFQGMEVITMPPPSSGGLVLLQVLAILEGFPLPSEIGPDGEPTARAFHWWIEAMRAAFADRAHHMGDPDSYPVPIDELLASEWIGKRRVGIGERANVAIGPWTEAAAPGSADTTHLSVLDSDGNACSLTTTLNRAFGCGILVRGAGFFLNNQMDDFSIVSGVPNVYGLVGGRANQLAPGRRPLSSMTPTVLREGGNRVSMVLGSPGGPRIISSVIQIVLRTLVCGQDLATAVAAPRVHQQWNPRQTWLEPHFSAAARQDLANRGHDLEPSAQRWGSIQAIYLPEAGGDPSVVSDDRRGGSAAREGEEVPPAAGPESGWE